MSIRLGVLAPLGGDPSGIWLAMKPVNGSKFKLIRVFVVSATRMGSVNRCMSFNY